MPSLPISQISFGVLLLTSCFFEQPGIIEKRRIRKTIWLFLNIFKKESICISYKYRCNLNLLHGLIQFLFMESPDRSGQGIRDSKIFRLECSFFVIQSSTEKHWVTRRNSSVALCVSSVSLCVSSLIYHSKNYFLLNRHMYPPPAPSSIMILSLVAELPRCH